MSCVVGIADGKRVWMGADSRATSDGGFLYPHKVKKMFRIGKALVGMVGIAQHIQIARFGVKGLSRGADDEEILYKTCQRIRKLINPMSDGDISQFIFGLRGQLWVTDSCFGVLSVEPRPKCRGMAFYAIGSAGDIADTSVRRALYSGKKDPKAIITDALDECAESYLNVGPPMIVESI